MSRCASSTTQFLRRLTQRRRGSLLLSPLFGGSPGRLEYPAGRCCWKSTATAVSVPQPASLPPPRFSAFDNNNINNSIDDSLAPTITTDIPTTTFPSLIIKSDGSLHPIGSFATSQAHFLHPDADAVDQLADALLRTHTGVVAHYYMDVELQGVLQAAVARQPQLQHSIGVADSLKMGDMALEMARDRGLQQIICLGVDFMSESVRAILDQAGYNHVPVYRAAAGVIGCSLAESAERDAYRAWLQHETMTANQPVLHVVYINTSLATKAVASSLVPTITCTSSNVLATLLQASAQIPNLKLLYGPDTYMGQNLITLLSTILGDTDENGANHDNTLGWSDERIRRELHPAHDRRSLRRLRHNIVVFPAGNCVVHHMFGASVVETVRRDYRDAYVTAHLEVPSEMFRVAMQHSLQDRGVVGSTSDILKFITKKVNEAVATGSLVRPLQFVLGTEAGMVTSIVQNVSRILQQQQGANNNNNTTTDLQVEIIFPVSNDAVLATPDHETTLAVVPGVAGGEGCSTAGGCATCPFMKMNDLDALMRVLDMIEQDNNNNNGNTLVRHQLQQHLPPDRLRGKRINGQSAVELGSEAILYMRQFMKDQTLPPALVQKIMATANSR